MPKTVRIEIKEGPRLIDTRQFNVGQMISLGRSKRNDIVLDTKDISRRHCTFELMENGFSVTDHSLNGMDIPAGSANGLISYNAVCTVANMQLHIQMEKMHQPEHDAMNIRHCILSRLADEIQINEVRRNSAGLRFRVESIIERMLHEYRFSAEKGMALRDAIRDEALGLGPLESLLKDDSVSEIMVNAPDAIYMESNGVIKKTDLSFSSENSVRTVIDRIVAPLGRRIDEASPMVDARLPDGSRVNAVIPPLALKGATITIRKFSKQALTSGDLISFGAMSDEMAMFLSDAVLFRQNIIISGGTGSGKTTLLNVLSAHIPPEERIVTIEDAAELQLHQPHVVSLESRPKNSEGKGEITIRDLLKNALRMRPDRIIVGECRGSETLDMLQAMNTGHSGSLTTTHANAPAEAVSRLETLALMAGLDLPLRAIREQIAAAIDLIIQQKRFPDGSRRITHITEVSGIDAHGRIESFDLWRFVPTEASEKTTQGDFQSTGRIPSFLLQKGGVK